MDKSESIKEIAKALHLAQSEMRGAKKAMDNPFFKSKYADLSEVIDVLREPLKKNGLSFSQFPISSEGMCGVETVLMHSSGEWLSQTLLLACSKQDPQGYGSAITYARRYALQSIFGIPSEDDDANYATGNSYKRTEPKRTVPNNTESPKVLEGAPKPSFDFESILCECGKEIPGGKYKYCFECNKKKRQAAQ